MSSRGLSLLGGYSTDTSRLRKPYVFMTGEVYPSERSGTVSLAISLV